MKNIFSNGCQVLGLAIVCLHLTCLEAAADENPSKSANGEAAKIIDKVVRQLPDGTWMSGEYNKPSFGSSQWSARYWQYSGLTWKLEAQALTKADQLNGKTWKGTISLTADAYRDLYESSSPSRSPCWRLWMDVQPTSKSIWSLELVDGQWKNLPGETGVPLGQEVPSQNDIDRVLKLPRC